MAEPIDLTRRPGLVFRDPSRRPWARLVARGLIQLLLVGLLPAEWQVRVALWPAFAYLAVQGIERRLAGLAPAEGDPGTPDALVAGRPAVDANVSGRWPQARPSRPGSGERRGTNDSRP